MNFKKTLACFFFLSSHPSFGAPISAQSTPSPIMITCPSTKEFITAHEFLRFDDRFKLQDSDARELAFKIAEGCAGSAKRFIRVAKTLGTGGADLKDMSRIGLSFALGSDPEADAFIVVFRRAIASDSLDLTLSDALKIALSLSKDFPGNLEHVSEDFERLIDFCSDSTHLGLPRVQCGAFASKLTRLGERWDESVSLGFIKSFNFLKSEKGPALTTGDAMKIAESLIESGPGAYENFVQAYPYAISETGLKLSREAAIGFAKKLAAVSVLKSKSEEPKKALEKPISH